MSKKANTAMIGVFVIGAVVLAVVGILAFGSGTLLKETDTFVLFFDGDLQGLSVGSPVLFKGVPVGQVQRIAVYYESYSAEFHIPVVIQTDPARFHEIAPAGEEVIHEIEPDELERLVKAGLRAQLSLQSLVTGQLAIKLDLFPNTPVHFRGDGSMQEIPTIPSSFERLFNAIAELDLKKLVNNVNRAMNALEEMIEEGALENMVADIDQAAKEAGSLAHELRGHAKVATDEFQMTAQTARGLMQRIENQVDPVSGEAIQTLEEIQKAMDQAELTLIEFRHLAMDYSADSDFGFELATALSEMAATARSVRALTDMLQQQPDALLRGKGASGGN